MLMVIRQVLAREDALALGRSIAAAQWVDGNVTSGDGAALAKRNRQLPEDSDVARDARRAVQRLRDRKARHGHADAAVRRAMTARPAMTIPPK